MSNIDSFIAESIAPAAVILQSTALPADPQVAYIVRELRAVLNNDISKLRIMIAVHQGVLIMRKFDLPGARKKVLLSEALRYLVDHSAMTDDDKMASHMLLDLGMADTIDNLVFMATNKIRMTPWCCFGNSKIE